MIHVVNIIIMIIFIISEQSEKDCAETVECRVEKRRRRKKKKTKYWIFPAKDKKEGENK